MKRNCNEVEVRKCKKCFFHMKDGRLSFCKHNDCRCSDVEKKECINTKNSDEQ